MLILLVVTLFVANIVITNADSYTTFYIPDGTVDE